MLQPSALVRGRVLSAGGVPNGPSVHELPVHPVTAKRLVAPAGVTFGGTVAPPPPR